MSTYIETIGLVFMENIYPHIISTINIVKNYNNDYNNYTYNNIKSSNMILKPNACLFFIDLYVCIKEKKNQ